MINKSVTSVCLGQNMAYKARVLKAILAIYFILLCLIINVEKYLMWGKSKFWKNSKIKQVIFF